MQPVFLGQFPADFRIAYFDILVRHSLPLVPDPVVDQMAVRMGLVEVMYQQILRVGNTHFLHIFFGDLRHRGFSRV